MSRKYLNSAFKVKIFDFILSKGSKPEEMSTFSFGEWHMYHSSQTPLTKHTFFQGFEYYFLGTVFDLNHLSPTKSIGHYLGIEYNLQDKTIRLFRSRNSFLGVY
jgi:hypothetical protein